MTEHKRVKARRRAQLYRKAHNILSNNIPRAYRYGFIPLHVKDAPRMIGIGHTLSRASVGAVAYKVEEEKTTVTNTATT